MPTKPKTRRPKAAAPKAKAVPRVTKHQTVVALLRRPEGATAKEIMDATGWQPHTVRGFICTLRAGRSGKREFEPVAVETVREKGGTRYRAVA